MDADLRSTFYFFWELLQLAGATIHSSRVHGSSIGGEGGIVVAHTIDRHGSCSGESGHYCGQPSSNEAVETPYLSQFAVGRWLRYHIWQHFLGADVCKCLSHVLLPRAPLESGISHRAPGDANSFCVG